MTRKTEDTVLVVLTADPKRRMRVNKKDYDAAVAKAKEAKTECKFTLEEDQDAEGGDSFDDLTEEQQEEVKARQELIEEGNKLAAIAERTDEQNERLAEIEALLNPDEEEE